MPVVYIESLKNARLDEVTAALGTAAELEIGDTGFASVLATIPLANPAAPAATGGVLTFTMPQSDTGADDSGTAAEARITDGGSNVIVDGLTVGVAATPSPDVILDTVTITAGQVVTITSATITHG